jgi:hypothetical protein
VASSNIVEILLKARDDAARTLNQATSNVDKLADRARKARVPLLLMTGALTAGAITAVKAASDLTESVNKATVVFGDATDKVNTFAETSADKFGISKRAAFEYSGTLGTILQASGLAAEASSGMSVELVTLAADLASFNNIPIAQALEKLRSGLVGEVEPLRTVGVLLNQAAVEEKALELGLVKAGEAMTEAAKVQARYALILEQTTVQQGDAIRTGDELAGQTRKLQASMEDLRAELGDNLLPIAQRVVGSLLNMTSAVSKLSEPVQNAVLAAGGLGIALGVIGLALPPLTVALHALGGVLAFLTGPIGLVIIAAGLLGFAWYEVITAGNETRRMLDEQAVALDLVNQKYDDSLIASTRLANAWVVQASEVRQVNETTDALGFSVVTLIDDIESLTVGLDESSGAAFHLTGMTAKAAAGLDVIGQAAEDAMEQVDGFTEGVREAQHAAMTMAENKQSAFDTYNWLGIPEDMIRAAVDSLVSLAVPVEEAWALVAKQLQGRVSPVISDVLDQMLGGFSELDDEVIAVGSSFRTLAVEGEDTARKVTTSFRRAIEEVKELQTSFRIPATNFERRVRIALQRVIEGTGTNLFPMMFNFLQQEGIDTTALRGQFALQASRENMSLEQTTGRFIGELTINLSGVSSENPAAIAEAIADAINDLLGKQAASDEQVKSS